MKIKEQIRKLATDCSKHCFEVVNKTDGVSNIYLRQGKADVIWRDFRRVLIAGKSSCTRSSNIANTVWSNDSQ